MRCWVGEIEYLSNINYKMNDVYSRDPFKHPNGVLHCGWSKDSARSSIKEIITFIKCEWFLSNWINFHCRILHFTNGNIKYACINPILGHHITIVFFTRVFYKHNHNLFIWVLRVEEEWPETKMIDNSSLDGTRSMRKTS